MFARGLSASWANFGYFQFGDLAVVTICDLKVKAIKVDALVDFRQSPKGMQHQAADGIKLIVDQAHIKEFVELAEFGNGFNIKSNICGGLDWGLLMLVGFIFNFANNLLQNILNSKQTGNTSIFIDHYGHMVALLTEFLQQDIQAFAFGDNGCRAQQAL